MLLKQTETMGLRSRVHLQVDLPDPAGKDAGCFTSHVKAWHEALDLGCSSLLVMEEDAWFVPAVIAMTNGHVTPFLKAAGQEFDYVLLGYDNHLTFEFTSHPVAETTVETVPDFQCIYEIHNWFCTTSYVISRRAMLRNYNWTYTGTPIDDAMSQADRNRTFTARPNAAFQRDHVSGAALQSTEAAQTGGIGEVDYEDPQIRYGLSEPLQFAMNNITSPPQCLPPIGAYVGMRIVTNKMPSL